MDPVTKQLDRLNSQIDGILAEIKAAEAECKCARTAVDDADIAVSAATANDRAALELRHRSAQRKEEQALESLQYLKNILKELLQERKTLNAKLPGPGEVGIAARQNQLVRVTNLDALRQHPKSGEEVDKEAAVRLSAFFGQIFLPTSPCPGDGKAQGPAAVDEAGNVEGVGGLFPLVQREKELTALVGHMGTLRAGHRRVGTLQGPLPREAEYNREAHLQLLLGVPGVGKTTLLQNLAPLILERLKDDPQWLTERPGFRDCLEACLDTSVPYIFTMDLKQHVEQSFAKNNLVLRDVAIHPDVFLALLLLLALCLRLKPEVENLDDLVMELDDELLAILRPRHVVNFIHDNLPRKDAKADSFIIFAFDEASSLPSVPRRCVSGAFGRVVSAKGTLGRDRCFTVLAATMTWGQVARRLGRALQHMTPLGEATGQLQESDPAVQLTPSGMGTGRLAHPAQAVYLGILTTENMEQVFRSELRRLGIELEELPAHANVLLEYAGGVPQHIQLLLPALAGSGDPARFNLPLLREGLNLLQDPPRLKDAYRRLLGFLRNQIFSCANGISSLQRGEDFGRVMRSAVLAALSKRRVREHDPVLQAKRRSPTYSQLQAFGLFSLQLAVARGEGCAPVRAGECDEYIVVMSASVVDAYITTRHEPELGSLQMRIAATMSGPETAHYQAKELCDVHSFLFRLEMARILSRPSMGAEMGAPTLRDILCLPETAQGSAFDLELDLEAPFHQTLRELKLSLTPSKLEHWLESGFLDLDDETTARVDVYIHMAAGSSFEGGWGCRLATKDPAIPFLFVQGQLKRVAPERRDLLHDYGMALICEEAAEMNGRNRPDTVRLIVADELLPAAHGLKNVAVVQHADETFYNPIAKVLRVLSSVQDASLEARMPPVPGVKERQHATERTYKRKR